jgi:hypothetical protein
VAGGLAEGGPVIGVNYRSAASKGQWDGKWDLSHFWVCAR